MEKPQPQQMLGPGGPGTSTQEKAGRSRRYREVGRVRKESVPVCLSQTSDQDVPGLEQAS